MPVGQRLRTDAVQGRHAGRRRDPADEGSGDSPAPSARTLERGETGPMAERLALRSRGRRHEIATFLGPDEKAAFAGDLTRALVEARRGRRRSEEFRTPPAV